MLIKFYSAKRALIKSVTDEDAHFIRVNQIDPDYMVVIKSANLAGVSFIEVVNGDKFHSRWFVRFGQLVQFCSFEPDRSQCKCIKKQLIAYKPTHDWNKFIMDCFYGKIKDRTKVDFYRRYLIKPLTL